ncbi:MAG TPA: hypothetical protein VFA41_17150 [Ktedonobacteraceae bacterium]|jgi:hypothetical protein|nr:hypothetical protein [Ktedonobacteraceae bacterium]
MSSRRTIAAINRPHIYERSVAPHVRRETVEWNSDQDIFEYNGSYFVSSLKFAGYYYRVVQIDGVWHTSTKDERVAAGLVERVKLYQIKKNAA